MAHPKPPPGGHVSVDERPLSVDPAHEGSLRLVVVGAPNLLRDCLLCVLEGQSGTEVAAVAATVAEALAAVAGASPEVVVLDPQLVGEDGLSLIAELRKDGQDAKVMIVGEDQSPHMLRRAFNAGASSYMSPRCTAEEVLDAVRRTAAGQTVVGPDLIRELVAAASAATRGPGELSVREQQVLEHISCGATNAEIARQLDVSVRTVQKHLENLFRQFGVHERAAVVAEAFRQGLLS